MVHQSARLPSRGRHGYRWSSSSRVADRRSWYDVMAIVGGAAGVAYDRRGYGDSIYEPEPFSRSAKCGPC